MDWKYMVGILLGLYGAGFALMNARPRVYQALANFLTHAIGWLMGVAGGVWMGATTASTLLTTSLAKVLPDTSIETSGKLVAPMEKFTNIAGWMAALLFAAMLGHMVLIILAHLSVQHDQKKVQQDKS
ncbi:hypothetical protein [Achromobacter spanius]